jgi:hypothetical protein
MTHVTVDSSTEAQLHGSDPVMVCSPTGQPLGYFHPLLPAGSFKSPISDEELARRRQQRTGSPLHEVLRRLGDQ